MKFNKENDEFLKLSIKGQRCFNYRFMERHELVFRSITSNTGKSFQNLTENEASIVKKFRKDFHSIIHSKNIKPENIFNSDQTRIYY